MSANVNGDVSQGSTHIEDAHYQTKNSSDDNIKSKSGMRNVLEKLITEESKLDGVAMSMPFEQSAGLETRNNVENEETDKNDQKGSTEFANNERASVDEARHRQSAGPQVPQNGDNKNNNAGSNTDFGNPKEYDTSIDERLPETVTLLTTPDGGKVYLIGTAHFSVESQKDVSMIIQAVRPHVVVVEVCKSRMGLLQLNEEVLLRYTKNISFEYIRETLKEFGLYNGIAQILLLRMAAHVTKQLGMPPGGEFRTAFEEASKIPNCILTLADRPIGITLQRAMRSLSWWEAITLAWSFMNMKDPISKEDVELYKQRSVLDAMIAELKHEYPSVERVFVEERDLFLAYSLQLSCLPRHTQNGIEPTRVVGVVGIGHVPGILSNWGKVKRSDIIPVLSIPPQTLSTKILKFTVKASLVGAIVYMGYKIIPFPSGITLQSIKSSVQGLLKATARADEYDHAVPGVMYVVNNIPGPGVDIENFESEYSLGCSCILECTDRCSCTRGSPNYCDGRILDDKLDGPIIECNSYCTCGENCGNRLVPNGPLDSLVVSKVDGKGLALLSSKDIKKGQFICEYAGEVISVEEARRRVEANKRDNSMNYVLVVSEHIGDRSIVTCVDPKYFGNIGRYSNHSCEPNASLVPVRVEGVVPRLCLFALKNIDGGEEITFNYAGVVINSVHNLSDTPCLCNSNNCLGYLPHDPI